MTTYVVSLVFGTKSEPVRVRLAPTVFGEIPIDGLAVRPASAHPVAR
ncbi:hypothetical protein [Mycolicibacterium brisbanense]